MVCGVGTYNELAPVYNCVDGLVCYILCQRTTFSLRRPRIDKCITGKVVVPASQLMISYLFAIPRKSYERFKVRVISQMGYAPSSRLGEVRHHCNQLALTMGVRFLEHGFELVTDSADCDAQALRGRFEGFCRH